MTRILLSILAFLLASGTCSLAQSYTVSGIVKDPAGTALPQMIVTLLHSSDSSSAGFGMTDEKGIFTFAKIPGGSYILAIRALGYAPFTNALIVNEDVTALELVLVKNTTSISEVTITDKKLLLETSLGKTIMNVSASTVSAGSNVLDLLRKAPGVLIQGSSITLQGTSVLVLVDDKQTYLSGEELADYLRALPAEQVAQIELITQPSSRYDAEGSGGIINIKKLAVRKQGVNGNLSLAAAQNKYPNTHNSLNLSWQKDDLTIYTAAGYFEATGSLGRNIDQVVRDPQTGKLLNESSSYSFQKETFSDYSLALGAAYKLSEKSTIGGSAKGIYHPNTEHDATYTHITDNAGVLTHNETLSDLGFLRHHYICNAYFRHVPARDHLITIDADYLLRDQENYLDLSSNNFNTSGQTLSEDLFLRNTANSLIQAAVLKGDYEASFTGNWKIEAGLKTSFSSTENGVNFEVLNNGAWRNDTGRTNTFIYRENINAGYLSINKPFGKKWKTQLGLRLENTNATGRQVVHDQVFSRTNTSLFPTGFISYVVNDKHSLEVNCGRRISRPAYTQLNPFIFFRSQYSYFQGNPALASSYQWFANMRHNWNNKVFTNARYGYTSGVVTPVISYDSSMKAVVAGLENYATAHTVSFSVNASKQFFKWWRCSPTVGVNYNAYDDIDRHKAVTSATGFYFSIENELNLSKGWTVDTSYHFAQGDLQNLLDLYGPRQWLGFNVSKRFWKENATLRLSVDDPFDMNRVTSTMNYNGVESALSSKWNTQQVALGFTYKFGRVSDSNTQRQTSSEEAGRM